MDCCKNTTMYKNVVLIEFYDIVENKHSQKS